MDLPLGKIAVGAGMAAGGWFMYGMIKGPRTNSSYSEACTMCPYVASTPDIHSIMPLMHLRARFPTDVDRVLLGFNKAAYLYAKHTEGIFCLTDEVQPVFGAGL